MSSPSEELLSELLRVDGLSLSESSEGVKGLAGLTGEEEVDVGFSFPLGVRYTSLTPP